MEFIRAKKPSLSLDMAPLIDIVFQLLIFFMLTSSFHHPALKLTLPKAVAKDVKEPERIVIAIGPSAVISVNQTKVSLEKLQSHLEEKLARDPQKSVHLAGDEKMPYGAFVQIMDIARQAGARQINILHQGKGEEKA